MFSKAGAKDDESTHDKHEKNSAKSSHHTSSHSGEKAEPVKVYLRVRPELIPHNEAANDEREGSGNTYSKSQVVIALDDKTIRLTPPDGLNANKRKAVEAVDDRLFAFDKVYNQESSQEEIYKDISSHVNATVRGYNTTVFAYGSTGSGKTFTMTGNSAAPGIIPRAISEIFSIIEATAAKEKDVFFYVRLSYVELYNNTFRNLLEQASRELADKERESSTAEDSVSMEGESSQSAKSHNTSGNNLYGDKHKTLSPSLMHPNLYQKSTKIEVRESQAAGIFLAGAHLRIPVITAQEAFQLINKGNKHRATGSTQCNDFSSRSHAILTLHVESRVAVGTHLSSVLDSISMPSTASPEPVLRETPELRLGKMHLVDLAGSERLTMSGAEGETLLETQSINLSLTAIGDVLAALSRNASILSKTKPHMPGGQSAQLVPVPYRNSKLTHLLKDSLGGNSKTIMIATVRTSVEFYQQTVVSLMYASRAKKVRNRSLVNRDVIGDTGIHAVSTEIERLKSRLDARTHEFESLRLSQMKESKENATLKTKLQSLTAMNDAEKEQLEKQMSTIITSQAGQLAHQRKKISVLQDALQSELELSQTRIKEQEKEISWLKTALDESAQTVKSSIPPEQLQRMQKIVDAWQGQAENTQRELVGAHAQIDALRSSNNIFGVEISALQSSKQELVDQMVKQRKTIEQLTVLANEAKADKASFAAAHYEVERSRVKVAEAVTMAEQGQLLSNKLRVRSDELAAQLDAAQQEVAWQKEVSVEYATKANEKIKNLEARCNTYETEKVESRRSYSKTLTMLEEKTSSTIENAVKKVQDMQAQLELECRRADTAQAELVALREHACQSSLLVHNDLQARDQTVVNLSEQLRLAHAQSNELAEHISESRAASKKKEGELAQAVAQLNHADSETERILDELSDLKNTNKKLVEEKSALQKSQNVALASLKQEHSAHVTALKQEHVRNEVEIRSHLQHTEAMIRDQVHAEAQRHTEEMVNLVESHRVAFMKLQTEAEEARADHDRTQEELRFVQHELQKQTKNIEDLLAQRKEAMLAHIAEAENARDIILLEKKSIEKQLESTSDQLQTTLATLQELQVKHNETTLQVSQTVSSELQVLRAELQCSQKDAEESQVALQNMEATHAGIMEREKLQVLQLTQRLEHAVEVHSQQMTALTQEKVAAEHLVRKIRNDATAAAAAHVQDLAEHALLAEHAALAAKEILHSTVASHNEELVQLKASAEKAAQQVLENEQIIHAEQLLLVVQQKEYAERATQSARMDLENARDMHAKDLEKQKADGAQVARSAIEATEQSLQQEVASLTGLLNASTAQEKLLLGLVESGKEEHKALIAREADLTLQLEQASKKQRELEAAHAKEVHGLRSASDTYMKKLTLTETQLLGSAAVVEELETELSQLRNAIQSKDAHVIDLALQHQTERDKLHDQLREQQQKELNGREQAWEDERVGHTKALAEHASQLSILQKQLQNSCSAVKDLEQQCMQLQSDLTAAHIAIEAEAALRANAAHTAGEAEAVLNALRLQMDSDSRKLNASKDNAIQAAQTANQQVQESYTKQLKDLEQRAAAHLQAALEMQKTTLGEDHQAALAEMGRCHKAAQERAESAAVAAMEALRGAHEKELRGIQADVEEMRKVYAEKVSQERITAQDQLAEALAVQKASLQEEHETHVRSVEEAYAAARTEADLRATASSAAAEAAEGDARQVQERMRDAASVHASALAAARSSTEAQLQKQHAAHRVSIQALERAHEERCAAQESRLQDIMTRHNQLEKQLHAEIKDLQNRLNEKESSLVSKHSLAIEEKVAEEAAHANELARISEQLGALQTLNTKLEARISAMQSEKEQQNAQLERAQAATAEQRVLRQQLDTRLTAVTVSATSRDERVREMTAERAELMRQMNAIKGDLDIAVAEAEMLRAAIQDMKKESDSQRSETSDTIAALRAEHDGLLEQLEADVTAVRADCAGEVQELRDNFRKQQEALERQYAARTEALSVTYATSQAQAESTAEARVSANATLMGKLVKTLEAEAKKMQDKLALREERLAEVEALHREATEQLASAEVAYNSRLAAMKQQHSDSLLRYEEEIAELKDRARQAEHSQAAEIDSVRADYTTTVRDLRETFALQRAALEEQGAAKAVAADERLKQEISRHKKELQRVHAAAEDEQVRMNQAVQTAEMRASDARAAAEALKVEMTTAINTLRGDKDAAVAMAPKLQAETCQLREQMEDITAQLEQHKRQLADAEVARNDMHAAHREAVKAARADAAQEAQQVEDLRKKIEVDRINHANAQQLQEAALRDMQATLSKNHAVYEAKMTRLAQEHEAELATMTRKNADEMQVNKEALLMLQAQIKEEEVAAKISKESALQEQEQVLRRHLDKESVHILDTHHAEIELLKEIHAREMEPIQEALRKAEWQVAVTMKCLTDMTDRKRLLQDHYSLDDMRQAIIARETEATRRAAEITAGRTPHSEPRVQHTSHAEQHRSPSISPIIASNTSDVTTPVVRRRLPLEPSVTGYSPEILAEVEEEEVERLNSTARDGASTGNTRNKIADLSEFSTLEIIHKGSSADSATMGQATDELVAAILDGDVQGLRTIVRARGGDLRSAFWKDLVPAVLPLHRAVAGLHFHGSESLLVSMLEALCSLGADINAADGTGNTCLHKAIQVCTSKSVVAVVSALLQKGADVQRRNHEGHTALHMECSRVRTASVYVITSLLEAGADPMYRAGGVSPLTMILQRGAAAAAVEAGSASLAQTGLDNGGWEQQQQQHQDDEHRNRHSGSRRVWVRAAQALVVAAGGKTGWTPVWAGSKGESQLHLLCSAFPPALEDSQAYEYLLSAALEAGLSPSTKDANGKTVLFALCERFAITSAARCPGSSSLIALMLKHCGVHAGAVVSEATRLGQSVFDLEVFSASGRNNTKNNTGSSPGDGDGEEYANNTLSKDGSCLQNAKRLLIDATLNRRSYGNAYNTQQSQNQNQSNIRVNFASAGYTGRGSAGNGTASTSTRAAAKTATNYSVGSEVDENAPPPMGFKSGFRSSARGSNTSNGQGQSHSSLAAGSVTRRVGRQNEVVLDAHW